MGFVGETEGGRKGLALKFNNSFIADEIVFASNFQQLRDSIEETEAGGMLARRRLAGAFDAKRPGKGFLHAMLREENAAPAEGTGLFLDMSSTRRTGWRKPSLSASTSASPERRFSTGCPARMIKIHPRVCGEHSLFK